MSIPDIGIGKGSVIRRAIIDVNTRIGSNCTIGLSESTLDDGDHGSYYVTDGIITIPKSAVIPDGTII